MQCFLGRVAGIARRCRPEAQSALIRFDPSDPRPTLGLWARSSTPVSPTRTTEKMPRTIHPDAFIHQSAHVIGDVTLGARASVWPTAVLRGDTAPIVVGDDSNVQDGAVLHVDRGVPCTIGHRVAIGHRAIVHGATVGDDCLIGMGAILLNRVVVGSGSIVGAGAVCTEGMVIPPRSLVVGVPGRVLRATTDAERQRIQGTVESYLLLQVEHRAGTYD
jgi:carbonic anhydrase/acetyltransferase-like protein (isoleucine patch superfamily)